MPTVYTDILKILFNLGNEEFSLTYPDIVASLYYILGLLFPYYNSTGFVYYNIYKIVF